jgi:hypothetical protein
VCRHFDAHPDGGYSIQRVSNSAPRTSNFELRTPQACQQFPRVATLSPLGTSVTLSAFCPTAASLLFDDAPFAIVTMEDGRRYEGLDATDVLPPLLRDGMLMDWDAVATWEELAVATLSTHRHDVERALRIIDRASRQVCATWTPAVGTLSDALTHAFQEPIEPIEPIEPTEPTEPTEPALARFCASHAFANWNMYRGHGILGAIDWLAKARTALAEERRTCVDLKEAMRQADLRLRHAISPP